MPRPTFMPITGPVLRWAIDESGLSDREFAQKIETDPALVEAWIAEQARPTKTQFSHIVRTLRRPSAAFFLPEPPRRVSLPPPLRRSVGARVRDLDPAELREIRWARRLQRLLAHLRAEDAARGVPLPQVELRTQPQQAAHALRTLLKVTEERQTQWKTPREAFAGWREAVEAAGVAVLLLPLGRTAIRGFALWNDAAPLVAVNTAFIPQARTFTLFHEVAHLLLRQDAASHEHVVGDQPPSASGYDVERWCERAAACVLLPESAVRGAAPAFAAGDRAFERAQLVARRFKVSVRAAAIRLIELDLAPRELYDEVAARSGALDRPPKSGGGGGRTAAQTRLAQVGQAAASSIVAAVSADRLSERDARDVLRLGGQGFQDLEEMVSLG